MASTVVGLEILGPRVEQAASSHELESRSTAEEQAISLPPIDGGFRAWLFIFCAFILECLVWGFPFSPAPQVRRVPRILPQLAAVTLPRRVRGVDQLHRHDHDWDPVLRGPRRHGAHAALPAVDQVAHGREPGGLRRRAARLELRHEGLAADSAAGCALRCRWRGALWPSRIMGMSRFPLNEWFVERRAFAASIIFGGSGLGGALFPVVTNYVLQRYGFRWALRSLALIVGVLGLVALLGAKPRLPVARHSTPAPLTFQFVRSPLFVLVALAVFVQALAYFPVSLYIPTYAASLGYSPGNGTLALTVFNLAAVIGECQVLVGYYCDRGPYSTAMLGSSLVAAGLAFLLWGYAHSLSLIVLFSVLFGAVSGGFSSVWPPAAKEVYADQSLTPFFLFSGAKGLAAISGPFIAASLHPRNGSVSRASWAGYGFTAVEIFVGSMMFATAILSAVLVIVREKTMKDRVE
ncbi:unnamed protein product [Mycena citricolor]|uniref:Major facilitator superfamily (MFS) profile domain-containing protein n=1 Tax=Mycena citricolor TaxID=2018698 RepID=A0AAD2HUN5_9AGAR|nr:unnamed protein product [Mycena citricolor]